jgi:signal transduction histidine kinase/ActR/RegA family two-component response regulator
MIIESHLQAGPAAGGADARSASLPDVASEVASERLAMLHAATLLPALVGLLFCLLPVGFLWQQAPATVLLGWLGIRALLVALRCADTLDYQRRPPPHERTASRQRRYLLLLTLDGVGWGAMALLAQYTSAPGFIGSLLATLIGVCAIALLTFNTSFKAYTLFATGALTPLLLQMLSMDVPAKDFSIPGLLVFVALSMLESRRIEARSLELLRLRYEYAHLAEARSAALQQAQRLADDKRQMVATLSHEIRTPLNGMLGMAQLMARSELGGPQASQLALMQRSGRHLLGLVNDMLDLSRIESGKLQIDNQPLVLRDSIDEVCQLLGGRAAEKGLRFECQLSPALPNCVVGDAARIKQVLHNLIGNAIKFTDLGSVRVVVDNDDETLRFAVHDTGEGIAANEIERIFVPFEQGGGRRMRRREGSGLGLAISRELARAMGGELECRSMPGQGSVFTFTLPWLPCAAVSSEPEDEAPALPALQGRVLLVEDCPVNMLVAATMLERCGLQVERAEDGAQALQRLTSERYDLMLLDCQLPDVDGLEVCERWRARELAHPGEAALPIIALTGSVGSDERARCLAAGMNDHLAKPFTLDELLAVVQRHLRGTVAAA